ncbi:FkbM family methyltransferase [Salinispora arenicola]|uniref:FkbM family methyltransferase n=1 Tax=Salinispora arenicola TaxID=168697 RepID=UPI000373275D|nr:FkbM family methyltransferase [Salinispora arenicola]
MKELTLPDGTPVMQINPGETALLYRDIFVERCYLQHGITVSPGGVVIDVGANIGMSVLFFHRQSPGLTFHAFEPAPNPYHALTANVALHGIDAVTSMCAISDRSGRATLTYYPDSTSMSGLHADAAAESALTRTFLLRSGFTEGDADDLLQDRPEPVAIECDVRTLSEVITERRMERIDLLKVDVEKSELEVLRGIEEAHWPRVRQVVAEVHDHNGALGAMTSLLRNRGFTVHHHQDRLLSGTDIHELFAVREDL